jgi:hypothetical protein
MSTVQEIESAITQLELKEVHAVADWLQAYRAGKALRAGSAHAVRQTMRDTPHLEAGDMAAFETAMEHGKIPVSEPWSFNERK